MKKAIVFNSNLPKFAENLSDFISEYKFKKIHDDEISKSGFIPPALSDGNLVETFEGGYMFSLRLDIKKFPKVILMEKMEDLANKVGRDIKSMNRKDIKMLTDAAIIELAPVTQPTTTIATAYYHIDSGFIFIDGNNAACDKLMALLRQAMQALETTTLHVDPENGLTSHIADAIKGDRFFIGREFAFHDYLKIQDECNETIIYKDASLESFNDDISNKFENGFRVREVRLTHFDNLSFIINDSFKFKGISVSEEHLESSSGVKNDVREEKIHETAVKVELMVAAVKDLLELFDWDES